MWKVDCYKKIGRNLIMRIQTRTFEQYKDAWKYGSQFYDWEVYKDNG